jgi:hypothetical protein
MEGDALKLNFEIALEKIDTLTKHNNQLLDKVDALEIKLEKSKFSDALEPETPTTRYNSTSKAADAAMKRFTAKIKKEINKNAKSKQSQGQPV